MVKLPSASSPESMRGFRSGLDDTHTGPLIPALLALHLTLVSEDEQVYSGAELRPRIEAAGFAEVSIPPFLAAHSGLVIARMADRER